MNVILAMVKRELFFKLRLTTGKYSLFVPNVCEKSFAFALNIVN